MGTCDKKIKADVTHTCCAAGPQSHRYLGARSLRSSYCCGTIHPAKHKKAWSMKSLVKHSISPTERWELEFLLFAFELVSKVELHLRSQRLVDPLHQPGESATIHGLGQGIAGRHCLLIIERADHLWRTNASRTCSYETTQYVTTGEAKQKKERHLLSFGSEFLVSECLPEGRTINTQQLENNNTSVLSCTSSQDFVHIWTYGNIGGTVLTFARLFICGSVVT